MKINKLINQDAIILEPRMTPVETGTVVGIFAEGKTHALAVGGEITYLFYFFMQTLQ